jgi:hypothetical protein
MAPRKPKQEKSAAPIEKMELVDEKKVKKQTQTTKKETSKKEARSPKAQAPEKAAGEKDQHIANRCATKDSTYL